jgi:hypothetical protein
VKWQNLHAQRANIVSPANDTQLSAEYRNAQSDIAKSVNSLPERNGDGDQWDSVIVISGENISPLRRPELMAKQGRPAQCGFQAEAWADREKYLPCTASLVFITGKKCRLRASASPRQRISGQKTPLDQPPR